LAVLSGTSLAVLYPCFPGWQRALAAATAIALLVLAAISTASTAYVGLAASSVLLAFNWLRRVTSREVPRPTSGEIEWLAVMLAFVAQTMLRRAAARDPIVVETVSALKTVVVMSLVLGVTSGTSADFGVGNAAIYGVIAGLACSSGAFGFLAKAQTING